MKLLNYHNNINCAYTKYFNFENSKLCSLKIKPTMLIKISKYNCK